jgi:uncharacterized protein (DUF2141 family)
MKALVLVSIAALAAAGAAEAGDVTVNVKGIQARHGTMYVVLDDSAHFLKGGAPYVQVLNDPPAGDHTFVMKDVAPGDYAVVILHDENGDKQMNYSSGGMPLEGWSMTRYDPNTMAPPTFDDAKVTVPASGASFDVEMHYPQ